MLSKLPASLLLALSLLSSPALAATAPPSDSSAPWLRLGEADRRAVEALAGDYMSFLREATIPTQRVKALKARLERAGFKPYSASERWQPGAKFYLTSWDRAMILVVVGKDPLAKGVRLVGAHLDSPRLDLRLHPFKTSDGLLTLKAEPYGSVKRYQWANIPLALVGQVARLDGKVVDVSIGMEPGDPVFVLPDLAPHVDKAFRSRTADEVFKGDELGVVAGSLPVASGTMQAAFLDELRRRYGVTPEDLISGQLSLVPAQPPREVGWDRGVIGAYGQDDALCSFAAAQSLIDVKGAPAQTSLVLLVDHEEVGNVNVSGVRSRFIESALEGFLAREAGGKRPETLLSTVLENSVGLSADVSQAANPNFPSTEDPQNTAQLGKGMVIKRMKPGFDASVAFRARLRRILADSRVPWQTYSYKVDGGGGATIGARLQEFNMDVADVGVPLLAMHGTMELSSKADVFWLKRFFEAFWTAP